MRNPSIFLSKKLTNHIQDLLNTTKANRLPKTVIGAEHKEIRRIDKSGPVPNPIAPKLTRELVKIAPLGEKGYDNYVGCCCEVRSSNQIILIRPSVPIEHITFTEAKRPFSGQTIKRCQNCKAVFG